MRPHRVPSEFVVISSLIATIALIGAIDAAVGAAADLVVLFSAIGMLAVISIGRSWARRAELPVRGDLVEWLSVTAAAQGETVSDLADRALGAYRAGLVAISPDPASGPGRGAARGDTSGDDAADRSGRVHGSAT